MGLSLKRMVHDLEKYSIKYRELMKKEINLNRVFFANLDFNQAVLGIKLIKFKP